MEWRIMVRLNMVVPVEYVQTVMGDWVRLQTYAHRDIEAQKRHIFEAKIQPLLWAAQIRPFLFWIQCIPDSSYHPERPPMFNTAARKPLLPQERALYGYGP
jgi:hypothetical protein